MILNLRIKNVQINFDSWILPLIKAESCMELKTKTTTTNVLPFFETWNVQAGLEHDIKCFLQLLKNCKRASYIFPMLLVKLMHFHEAEVSCNSWKYSYTLILLHWLENYVFVFYYAHSRVKSYILKPDKMFFHSSASILNGSLLNIFTWIKNIVL